MAGVGAFNHRAGHLQDRHGEHGAVHAIGRRLGLIDKSTQEGRDVSEIGRQRSSRSLATGIHSIDPVRAHSRILGS